MPMLPQILTVPVTVFSIKAARRLIIPFIRIFFLSYGVFGIGAGAGGLPSLFLSIEWYPLHRGYAILPAVFGYGLTSMLFPIIITYYVTPWEITPQFIKQKGIIHDKFFEEAVKVRIPMFF